MGERFGFVIFINKYMPDKCENIRRISPLKVRTDVFCDPNQHCLKQVIKLIKERKNDHSANNRNIRLVSSIFIDGHNGSNSFFLPEKIWG
jgi:hypothetical protein